MWALSTCGAQAGSSKRHKGEQVEGVKGLKSLGWAGSPLLLQQDGFLSLWCHHCREELSLALTARKVKSRKT